MWIGVTKTAGDEKDCIYIKEQRTSRNTNY